MSTNVKSESTPYLCPNQLVSGMTAVIGRDVWFDHASHCFRPKQLDLTRVPLMFRCPTCGSILARPGHRDEMFNEAKIDLGLYGGVCRDCWMEGFGKYGERGKLFGIVARKDEQRQREAEMKRPVAFYSNGRMTILKPERVFMMMEDNKVWRPMVKSDVKARSVHKS